MTFRIKAVILKRLVEAIPGLRAQIPPEIDLDQVKVVALRIFGAVQRGEGKPVFHWMVPKMVHSGGGGPIENEELWRLIGDESETGHPRPWKIKWGSIIHTDAARAYANLSWDPMRPKKEDADEDKDKNLEGAEVPVGQVSQVVAGEHPEVQSERLVLEAVELFHADRRTNHAAQKYKSQYQGHKRVHGFFRWNSQDSIYGKTGKPERNSCRVGFDLRRDGQTWRAILQGIIHDIRIIIHREGLEMMRKESNLWPLKSGDVKEIRCNACGALEQEK